MSRAKELASVILVFRDKGQAGLQGHDIQEGSRRVLVIARAVARTAVCDITVEVYGAVVDKGPANRSAGASDAPVDASRVAGNDPVIPAPGGLHLEPEQDDAEHTCAILLPLCSVTGIAGAVSRCDDAGSDRYLHHLSQLGRPEDEGDRPGELCWLPSTCRACCGSRCCGSQGTENNQQAASQQDTSQKYET